MHRKENITKYKNYYLRKYENIKIMDKKMKSYN